MVRKHCGALVYLAVLLFATVSGDMARQQTSVRADWREKVPRLDPLDGRRQVAPGKTRVIKNAKIKFIHHERGRTFVPCSCHLQELRCEGEVCKQVFKRK